ncbi:MAG TPA: methyltransferase domain-containing protein [Candidatus Kapabacteria bacterium]|nr:methyltransferase domain-containing protein [Candidatus Kapabacteria bacterium]
MNTEAFFDTRSEEWTDLYIHDARFKRRLERIAKFFGRILPQSAGHALDVGCGSGVFSRYLAERGWAVTAIDASSAMIEAAKAASHDRSIEYWQSTIEAFDAPNRHFDTIVALSMLEYVDDDEAVIEKFKRLLSKGGVLIVSVPNRAGLLRKLEGILFGIRTVSRDRIFGMRGEYLKHQKRQYSPFELDILMRQFGLKKQGAIYLNAGFAGPAWLLPLFERRWWAAMYCAGYRSKDEI